jgi:hypothetical protein
VEEQSAGSIQLISDSVKDANKWLGVYPDRKILDIKYCPTAVPGYSQNNILFIYRKEV